ncbi:MAG: DUF4919 domain-containing protein [Muribaculaceae bacterium]|nr:DUF4919 domain-containing protein [Muribaculaceae bacterium]
MKLFSKLHIYTVALLALLILSAAAPGPPGKKPTFTPPKFTIDPPDMDKIKEAVSDPTSRYYYPRLMANYERNDTVMTLNDYRHLYLGMVFQEDYDPYRPSAFDYKVEEIYYRDNHTREELDSMISYAEQSLENDPFDLQQINFLIYALQKAQKVNRAKIWQYRLNHLLEAILSTGNGIDPENAWVVINPRHAYNILNFHNSIAEKVEFQPPCYDFIRVVPTGDEKQPEGYYFNIKYILEEYYRKHPEQLRGTE